MSSRYLQIAAKDGRMAVLPAFLAPGREVWFWRSINCREEVCHDSVTAKCPLNRGLPWYTDAALDCVNSHPVLDHAFVWEVSAIFTADGIMWEINYIDTVADRHLRETFFPSREAAERSAPRRILHE